MRKIPILIIIILLINCSSYDEDLACLRNEYWKLDRMKFEDHLDTSKNYTKEVIDTIIHVYLKSNIVLTFNGSGEIIDFSTYEAIEEDGRMARLKVNESGRERKFILMFVCGYFEQYEISGSEVASYMMIPLTDSILIDKINKNINREDNTSNESNFSKTIKGLTAADIKLNFTDKGFSEDKNYIGNTTIWTLQQNKGNYDYRVVISGEGPTNIMSIDGTINGNDNDFIKNASDFLGYLASLPYENSQPLEAKKWVINNINKGSDTTISNVKFTLIANSEFSKILKIYK